MWVRLRAAVSLGFPGLSVRATAERFSLYMVHASNDMSHYIYFIHARYLLTFNAQVRRPTLAHSA